MFFRASTGKAVTYDFNSPNCTSIYIFFLLIKLFHLHHHHLSHSRAVASLRPLSRSKAHARASSIGIGRSKRIWSSQDLQGRLLSRDQPAGGRPPAEGA